MARINLSLLGSFQARLSTGQAVSLPTKKALALLAYLALPAGRAHERDKLAGLLWGDSGEAQARSSLRHTLVVLRKALAGTEAPSLLVDHRTLALNPAAVDVDVAAFERNVAHGTAGAPEEAAQLYAGDLLDGFGVREAPFEDWLLAERERLRELALDALARLLTHQVQTATTDVAIRTATRLLTLDPLRENVHRALMTLYARQGRRGAALRQYQICVGILQRELGVEPEVETKRLYQDLLQRRATASPPPAVAGSTAPRSRPAARSERHRPATPPEEIPLVGREPELASLGDALGAASEGRGRLAVVVGEAGIGKSRLLTAIASEAQRRGGRALVGHAYESEQVLAFGPWVDALRGFDPVTDVAVLDRLEPASRVELARLLPELGPDLEPAAPAADLRRTFEAVSRLVAALAADGPLVLVLEDLHWADETSVRLLAFLARRITSMPVLIGVTAREEEIAAAPVLERVLDELTCEPHVIRRVLARLSEGDTDALVRALARLGGADETVRQVGAQVWAMSEGNPFVVVETMRALQEGTAPAVTTALPLPERVRHLVTSRLARLGEHSRALVPVAAVIGREFDFALLERAAGLGAREAAEGVEELVRRRVLHGVGERLAFTHDRVREVAELGLLPARRRALHGRVARALEAVYATDLAPYYTALGRHYRESQAWDKAVPYLRLAGEQAISRSTHREAASNLEGALEALSHLPRSPEILEQSVDLRLLLRLPLFRLGEFERMGEHLRQAHAEGETLGDVRRVERVLAFMGTQYLWMGQHRQAIAIGERARALAPALGDPGLDADINTRLAWAWHSLGDYRKAIDLASQAVEALPGDLAYQHFGLGSSPAAFARYWLALSLAELGELREARAHGDECLRIAEVVGQPLGIIAACFGVGMTRLRSGELAAATAVLERGLGLCDPTETPLWSSYLASALGATYGLLGRATEAEPLLERAVEQSDSARVLADQALRVTWLGETCLARSRTDTAAAHAARALEMARATHERGNEAYALRLLGDVAARRGLEGAETAGRLYGDALALATELGMRPLVAHCHLALGQSYLSPGNREAHLRTATAMYREMGMSFWLTRAVA